MKLDSTLRSILILLLLIGCANQSQSVDVKNKSLGKDIDQSITVFGVSPGLHEEALKQGEKAKNILEELERDRSLSATAKRILAEAEAAREEEDDGKYLAKIQEYRKLLNYEPTKMAAKSWELEGQVLFFQLQVKKAQQAIEEAVRLDPDNPEYLITLADYLCWNGKYQRIEKVSIKAIGLIEGKELADELLLSKAQSSLGLAYLHNGKYDSANKYLRQVLEIREKVLGKEHLYVATSLSNLALLYESQGKYKKAELEYLKALEIYKRVLGEKHLYVATSLNNLALLYHSQGRYEEAEPNYLKALEIYKRVLGEEHLYVATSLNNLALLYKSQGRYKAYFPH